jgi:hypothetical protein
MAMLARRKAQEAGISEDQARDLIDLIGSDWNSVLRKARFPKSRNCRNDPSSMSAMPGSRNRSSVQMPLHHASQPSKKTHIRWPASVFLNGGPQGQLNQFFT